VISISSPTELESSSAGLTRAERKEQTRQAVLKAAADLFTRRGIEATSIDQVASAIGLTRGAVYASFRTKEDLVTAVGQAESVFLDLSCLWRVELTLEERFRLLATEVFNLLEVHGTDIFVKDLEFLLHAVRNPTESEYRFVRYRDVTEIIGRELERVAAERKEALPLPGWLLATSLTGLIRGLAQEELRQRRQLTETEIADALALLAG
jgi:AcrR family transcriptional regulator